MPLLAALLGVSSGERYPALNLSPRRQMQRTLEVLVEQLASLAQDKPVIELYEDIHWIDPSTLALLDLLVDGVRALPVLVVLTYRPEFTPPWVGRAHVTALPLNRLGRRQGAAMVERVTGKALPTEVLDQIVARTDGVPLFVEELTKTVLESSLLIDAGDRFELAGPLPPLAIPATLHDSLMARLDRLAPVKEIAQMGAAIGREFSHELLAAVSPMVEADLSSALDQLVSSELIFRRGTPPQATYTFKHALVQDAAYQSLLRGKRQELHARIVQALEERLPETTVAQPELLAHHCGEAGLVEKAVAYWQRAGQRALERSATVEAVAQLTKGLEVLEGLPKTPARDRQELDFQLALGAALIAAKGYAAPETGAAFEQARRLCDDLGDRQRLVPVLYGQTLFHMDAGRHPAALQVAEHLLGTSADDRTAQLLGHRLVGTCSMHMGQWSRARRHQEAAMRLYDPKHHSLLRHTYAQDQLVTVLAHLAWSLLPLGFPEQSLARALEALHLAKELNHSHTLAFALHAVCKTRQVARDAPRCQRLGDELLAVSAEHGFAFHRCGGWSAKGSALLEEGRTIAAESLLERSLDEYRAAHAGYLLPMVLCELARAKQMLGKTSEALELVREGLTLVESNEERSDEAPLHALQGEVLLASGEGDRTIEAEACLHKSVEIARAQGARLFELRAVTSLARLWAERGERERARDVLAPVHGWFTEGFDTADLKDAKALLDTLP